MFKQYRKTAVAEINTQTTELNETGETCYRARDPKNHNDTYLMPVAFFNNNYEAVEKPNYTVLTADQRVALRHKLTELVSFMVGVGNAQWIETIQRDIGENYKTFEDKIKELDRRIEQFKTERKQWN